MALSSEHLVDNLKRMGIPLAYGEKVELGSSTLIPVAISGFGFGEGEGSGDLPSGVGRALAGGEGDANDEHGHGAGSGSGGGGFSIPVGAYVSDEFGTRFQPNLIALLVAVLPLAVVAGWSLPKLVKAIKR